MLDEFVCVIKSLDSMNPEIKMFEVSYKKVISYVYIMFCTMYEYGISKFGLCPTKYKNSYNEILE